MIKDIKYTGYTASPADYECNDGELATVINLIPEDGGLEPIAKPIQVGNNIPEGYKLQYIHQSPTGAYHNYIYTKDGKIYFAPRITDITFIGDLPATATLHQVSAIGNTLLVLTSEGMFYYLFKFDDNNYHALGNHIPEVPLSFGLKLEGSGNRFSYKQVDVEVEMSHYKAEGYDEEYWVTYGGTDKLTENVQTAVRSYLNDITDANHFHSPFFVRYALRTYDGSLIMHSAPVLMPASVIASPGAYVTDKSIDDSGNIQSLSMLIFTMQFSLTYKLLEDIREQLSKWADIIKSVDIFISRESYMFDQDGQVDTVFKRINVGEPTMYPPTFTRHLKEFSICDNGDGMYDMHTNVERFKELYHKYDESGGYMVDLPLRKLSDVYEDIEDCSTFYLWKSIPIGDLATDHKVIKPEEEGYLANILQKEVMTDDYDSHATLIPEMAFNYNARLNITGLSKKLFHGFSPLEATCYQRHYVNETYNRTYTIYYHIRTDSGIHIVKSDPSIASHVYKMLYLYYPDVSCFKATVMTTDHSGGVSFVDIPMKPHPFLNGSYYFYEFKDPRSLLGEMEDVTEADAPVLTSGIVNLPNKIYTSEVNNPFLFTVRGINTVGIGRIIGISSAAKALSEGQFGQFPLYAFTTEGVWALEVHTSSDAGLYKAIQPITRDVCISAKSITQLDSAVLFATDRGIMMLAGSQSQCISDVLSDGSMIDTSMLPYIGHLISMADVPRQALQYIPFKTFLTNCRMLYVYKKQRIIVYNNECDYAYVYSLKSKSWGMMYSDILYDIPSYPASLAVVGDSMDAHLADFGTEVDTPLSNLIATNGIIITRPIKLGEHDIHKTVDGIIQRGTFRNGHISCALYASNDLFNWSFVWSSVDHYLRGFAGTPFKYFRLVIICNMFKDESLYGCTFSYIDRLTNKIR